MSIGLEIRKLRKAKGLTQKGLAEKSGVSFTYISQIENDIRNVSITVLKELAEALEADKIELYKLAGFLDDDDIKIDHYTEQAYEFERHLKHIAGIKVRKNMKASHYQGLLLLAILQAQNALKEKGIESR